MAETEITWEERVNEEVSSLYHSMEQLVGADWIDYRLTDVEGLVHSW